MIEKYWFMGQLDGWILKGTKQKWGTILQNTPEAKVKQYKEEIPQLHNHSLHNKQTLKESSWQPQS